MGCIFGSPILEDTSILAHLRVRPYISIRLYTRYRNNAPGLLYTDGIYLHYEATCGGNKRACCLFCRQSFPLSSITSISVSGNSREEMGPYANILPSNFLKITGADFLVGVSSLSVDEMQTFARRLEQLIQSQHKNLYPEHNNYT